MSRTSALVTAAIACLILGAPLLARQAESESLFSDPAGQGIVADARNLEWTVRRLTSTIEAVTQSRGDWDARVLAIIAPSRPYDETDAAAAKRFVEDDGILLVADAFEEGNTVLSPFGLFFERGRLVETSGTVKAQVELGERTVSLDLDAPTGIHFDPDVSAEVLSWSSNTTFLDLDGDGVIGSSDRSGPFPLVVKVPAKSGTGYVIAIADPKILGGNTVNASLLRLELLSAIPGPGLLVVDESHDALTNPALQGAAAAARAVYLPPTDNIWIVVGVLFGLVALVAVTTRGWGPHQFRPERFITRSSVSTSNTVPGPRKTATWTTQGIAAIAGGAGLFVLGIRFQNMQAQYAGAFLLLAAAAASLVRAPNVHASLEFSSPKLQENVATTCAIAIDNPARKRVHVEVRAGLPMEMEVGRGNDFFQAVVPARQTLREEFELLPAVRGPYSLGPLEARSQDPLHLRTATTVIAPPIEVRVLPSQEQLRTLPFGTRVPMITMGPHLVNRAGEGMEFHSLRDYQLGDSIRIVNWKASARSKDLVVNQRVHETMTHLTIVLDARAVSGAGPADATPIARLSRAVASLASAMLRVRDRIRVFVYTGELIEAPHATGSRQLDVLLEILSTIRPAGNMPFKDVAEHLAPRLRPKTPILIATCAEADPTLADGLSLLSNVGLLPVLLAAPIHVEGDPGLSASEAQHRIDQRETILNEVRGVGVTVHELHPGVSLEAQFRLGGAA